MARKLLFMFLMTALTSLPSAAFRLVDRASYDEIQPTQSISDDNDGVTVSYSFPGAVVMEDDLYPGTFSLDIPMLTTNAELGQAACPLGYDSFELPEGYTAEVELLGKNETILQLKLAPERHPLPEIPGAYYNKENVPPVTPFKGWAPEIGVTVDDIQTYRGRRILYVCVRPVSYSYEEESVKVAENLTYRVNYIPDKARKKATSDKALPPVDRDFMSRIFTHILSSNVDSTSEPMKALGDISIIPPVRPISVAWHPLRTDYLILTVPEYRTAAEKMKAWKRKLGFNVDIVYASKWTPSKIKATVQNKYDDYLFSYLLLLGDEMTLPGMRRQMTDPSHPYFTDFHYSIMDGNEDMLPDIYIGRLPAASLEEANIMIDKIIKYEQNPPTKESFYCSAAHCAEFSDYLEGNSIPDGYEDVRFTLTSETIRDSLQLHFDKNITRIYTYNKKTSDLKYANIKPTHWNNGSFGNGKPIPSDLEIPGFKWNGNTSMITNAINSGILYLLYRGHGSKDAWSNPQFTSVDISKLSNGEYTPVVFSLNCETGMYQDARYSDTLPKLRTDCFAEEFLRKANGGCVGIIAPSHKSYSGYSDVMTMEMFRYLYPEANPSSAFKGYSPTTPYMPSYNNINRLGIMLAKVNMGIMKEWTESYQNYTQEIFHCFGDPSMSMYTNTPYKPLLILKHGAPSKTDPLLKDMPYTLTSSEYVYITKVDSKGNIQVSQGTAFGIGNDYKDITLYIHGDNIRFTEIKGLADPIGTYLSRVAQDGQNINVQAEIPDDDNRNFSLKLSSIDNLRHISDLYDRHSTVNSIDISTLSPGIYILYLMSEDAVIDSQKVIIK